MLAKWTPIGSFIYMQAQRQFTHTHTPHTHTHTTHTHHTHTANITYKQTTHKHHTKSHTRTHHILQTHHTHKHAHTTTHTTHTPHTTLYTQTYTPHNTRTRHTTHAHTQHTHATNHTLTTHFTPHTTHYTHYTHHIHTTHHTLYTKHTHTHTTHSQHITIIFLYGIFIRNYWWQGIAVYWDQAPVRVVLYALGIHHHCTRWRVCSASVKLLKANISFVMPVSPSLCPSAWNKLGRRVVKCYVRILFDNLSRKFKFHQNLTTITRTLYEDRYTA